MMRAFTLIELLVVITIIVVLLALLMPALEKAVYEAELTVCSGQIKAIATGVTTGAMDRQRYYPSRDGMNSPHQVMSGADTRPVLHEYLGVSGLNKILVDPFCEEADIDGSVSGRNTYGTYWMFFGWNYTGAKNGGPGMRRIGDRWTYGGSKFDVLVQDMDVVQAGPSISQWVSHPDTNGVLTPLSSSDKDPPWTTASHWVAATLDRGTVDLNFGAADCSVIRYRDIPKFSNQVGTEEETDKRMVQVGNFRDGDNTGQMGIVPQSLRR
jgi:prepilin-type N-terminal cleavage/methylation domain-containing protein